MIGRIITGIVITIIGVLMTIFADWIFRQTGRIAWAEKYLGLEGGTRMFWRLFGVLLFIVGLLWASGTIQSGFTNLFT